MKIFLKTNSNSAMSSALKNELKEAFMRMPPDEPEVIAVQLYTIFSWNNDCVSDEMRNHCSKNQVSLLKLLLDYAKIYQP
jgi:hypothetical protein